MNFKIVKYVIFNTYITNHPFSNGCERRKEVVQTSHVPKTGFQPKGKGHAVLGLINDALLAVTDERQQGHLSLSSPAGILLTG